MNSSENNVIRNLIHSETLVVCRLDRGKSEKIKKVQMVKHTEKRVKFVEGITEEIHSQMESEGVKNMMMNIS